MFSLIVFTMLVFKNIPGWFLNDNGQVISEDTKRQEPMKSIIKSKSQKAWFFGSRKIRIGVAHQAFVPINSVYQ
jgi:hypothetical protein